MLWKNRVPGLKSCSPICFDLHYYCYYFQNIVLIVFSFWIHCSWYFCFFLSFSLFPFCQIFWYSTQRWIVHGSSEWRADITNVWIAVSYTDKHSMLCSFCFNRPNSKRQMCGHAKWENNTMQNVIQKKKMKEKKERRKKRENENKMHMKKVYHPILFYFMSLFDLNLSKNISIETVSMLIL